MPRCHCDGKNPEFDLAFECLRAVTVSFGKERQLPKVDEISRAFFPADESRLLGYSLGPNLLLRHCQQKFFTQTCSHWQRAAPSYQFSGVSSPNEGARCRPMGCNAGASKPHVTRRTDSRDHPIRENFGYEMSGEPLAICVGHFLIIARWWCILRIYALLVLNYCPISNRISNCCPELNKCEIPTLRDWPEAEPEDCPKICGRDRELGRPLGQVAQIGRGDHWCRFLGGISGS
jgi:hypothetical protein